MVLCDSRSSEALSAKEREVTSVRRQLDNTSDELAEVGRAREVALRENRRLHEDLATMTRENQVRCLVDSFCHDVCICCVKSRQWNDFYVAEFEYGQPAIVRRA